MPRADGVLDVYKHRNCRCELFPVSGYITEESDLSGYSDDVKEKIAAARNHRRVFQNEDKQNFLNQTQNLSREENKHETEQTVKKTGEEDKQSFMNQAQEISRQEADKETDKQAESIFSGKDNPKQMTMNFTGEGEVKLTATVDAELKQVSKLNPRTIRALYALRSPMAMARMGTREGLSVAGEAGGEEGVLGSLSAAAPAIPPLLFFMLIPQIKNFIEIYMNSYMKTQMLKNQRVWNNDMQQQYRKAFRSLIPA